MAHGFDIMPVRIKHIGSIVIPVIVPAKPGSTMIYPADRSVRNPVPKALHSGSNAILDQSIACAVKHGVVGPDINVPP